MPVELAISELHALPPDAHERAVAENIVIHLRRTLADKPSRTPEEEEFVVKMLGSWEKGMEKARKEGRAEGRHEGLREGRAEGRADAVLTALEVRSIDVPDSARERILAEQNPARLKSWLKKAILANSIADVLGEPS